MTINSIGACGSGMRASDCGRQRELASYDQQIKELQRKIKETRGNNKLADDQKNELIQQYERQIQDLNMQKQQKQMAMAREQGKVQPEPSAPETVEAQSVAGQAVAVDENLQRSMIQAQTAQDADKAVAQVRAAKQGELRIAGSDSYARGPVDPEEVQRLSAELENIEVRSIARNAAAADRMRGTEASTEDSDPAQETEERGGTGRMEPGQYLDEEA